MNVGPPGPWGDYEWDEQTDGELLSNPSLLPGLARGNEPRIGPYDYRIAAREALNHEAIRHALRRGRSPKVHLLCQPGRSGSWHDTAMTVVLIASPIVCVELRRADKPDALHVHDGETAHSVSWSCAVCDRAYRLGDLQLLDLAVRTFATPIRHGHRYVAYVH